jgi:uncharacterized membrane protein YfcA
MKFTTNIGQTDRMIRFIAGAVLIVGALTGVIGAWGFVGVVPLATAFLRVCPAYSLIGFKTCTNC